MTHSIPEPNALAIRTKFGTVFHTGDWKIDPEPLLGEPTDEATLQAHRRRGRARHGLRQHQRLRRRRGGLRGDACAPISRSWSSRDKAGSPSPASPPTWRASRASPRPRSRPAAIRCCRAARCSAWSRRRRNAAICSISRPSSTSSEAGYLPRDKVAVHLHRQPGRAARRVASSPTTTTATWCSRRATPRSSPRASFPATSARSAGCRTP